MSNPRNLCVDVMGSTFTALLHLWADQETVEYTMTCTGTVQNGPYEMIIKDDPCNAQKGQSWTCEITNVGGTSLEYSLVGGQAGNDHDVQNDEHEHDHGPITGSIPLGACGISVVCPEPR
jgi:hypothetical protein